jgi:threonine dehydrogenase-like Zn-dependent dehydrogenase
LRAYARFTTVRAEQLRAIPPEVELPVAALALPLSECLTAVDESGWKLGLTAAVVGGGAIGLMTTALLIHGGAAAVVVSEPNPERRALVADLGAIAVPPDEMIDAVKRVSNGEGVDVAFECVGSVPALETAMSSLRFLGRLVLFGVAPHDATYDLSPRDLLMRGTTVVPAMGSDTTLVRALRLLPVIRAERFLADEMFPEHSLLAPSQ